jgi:hypothetical protein
MLRCTLFVPLIMEKVSEYAGVSHLSSRYPEIREGLQPPVSGRLPPTYPHYSVNKVQVLVSFDSLKSMLES